MLRNFCLQIWPYPTFRTNRTFLNEYKNWREMLKLRPLIRYDGIYRCQMEYLRNGLSYTSEHHPVHEVVTYKYVRFLRSGQILSMHTVGAPRKTFPKIKE